MGVGYLVSAHFDDRLASHVDYGSNSRTELFRRSLYIAADFPYLGGGLGSFPGLYSNYLLVIPYYFLPNSHNMFLDVTIEQGLFGGFAFLFLYFGSVWIVADTFSKEASANILIFNSISLLALAIAIIHGVVENYLYNGSGAIYPSLGWCGGFDKASYFISRTALSISFD
jgi:O-antigen ligase